MIFTRPKDVTLTQMAQWIDSHCVKTEEDNNLQVEYLYHLVLYKTKKLSLFNDTDVHDDFALYGVSKLLVRINNTEELPVKSITNYINNSIHHWHAEYVRAFCAGSPDIDMSDFDVSDFGDYLIDTSSEFDRYTFSYDCSTITIALLKHMKKIPHKKHSAEWSNICVSCFLTLTDRINSAIAIAQQLGISHESPMLSRCIRGLKTRPPILFHVDEKLSNYVSVLVNELVHVLAVELTYSFGTKVSASDCLKNMIMAAQNDEDV